MIDFRLTEEQEAVRKLAREFARKEIAPIAASLDLNWDPKKADSFPWEMLRKAQEIGLRTLTLPAEYGGFGAGVVTQLLALDELAYADMNCAKILSQIWKAVDVIAHGATEDQKKRFLPLIRDDQSFLVSLAFTEPDSGSDTILPYDGAEGGMKCTAEKKGDGFVLNGMKHYISLAPESKLLILGARTDRSLGANKGVSVFFVPKDTPGVSVGNIHAKICNHVYPSAELIFENAYIPKENLFGGKHGWEVYAKASRGLGNLELSVIGVAVARAAFEAAVNFARERKQGGKRIIDHQAVAIRLADMFALLQSCDAMQWRTAQMADHGEASGAQMMALKVLSSESAFKIILEALQIFGGLGVMEELPMERYLRDALLLLHGGGTADVLRVKLSKLLADDPNLARLL
jgi:alkylation response protein AidB-like acyl-CoA dehydrogenase